METKERRATVTWVGNVLDPLGSRRTEFMPAGFTFAQAAQKFEPLMPADFELIACLNGQFLEAPELSSQLLDGDSLVLAARPQGGGGGGKNILGTIAMIAVMVVATVVTYGIATAGWAATGAYFAAGSMSAYILGAAAGAAIMAVGGMVVNSMFSQGKLDASSWGDGIGSTPTYGWQAKANELTEGSTLPVLYGRFLVTPPLIARNVEPSGTTQYLNMLLGICDHEITAVETVKINDQDISDFRSARYEVRLGAADQAPVSFFGDLKEEFPVGVKLNTSWVTRALPGVIQGFNVGIGYRLYHANKKGGMDPITAYVQLEYRKKGASSWTRYTRVVPEKRMFTVATSHWTAGYWQTYSYGHDGNNTGRRWVKVYDGPSDSNAHYENERYYEKNQSWRDPGYRTSYAWHWVFSSYSYEKVVDITYDYLTLTSSSIQTHYYVLYRDYIPEGEYEVRVRLMHALKESTQHGSDVLWDFSQLIQYDDFSYPGTSVVGIRALATDQLSGSQPRVQILARRDHVWVFDATAQKYVQKAATNPAWACYDILHNGAIGHPSASSYGGAVPHSRIQYKEFKEWADWCDKKKYTVNVYFDAPLSLRQALDVLSVMGRGAILQIGSRFTVSVDKPVDASIQSFMFGMGNIALDSFNEAWLPLTDRANCVEISYFDEEANWTRQTVEIYQDGFDQTDRSIIKRSETLIACTNRQEALNYGKGLMLRNRYLTYMPNFETSVSAIHCLPGDPVDLSFDQMQIGYSGRIASATRATVKLDRLVRLEPYVRYAIEIQHLDDDSRETLEVNVGNILVETDLLTLRTPWKKIPSEHTNYSFGEIDRTTKRFIVTNIATSSDLNRRLTLLEYVPEIFDEQNYQLPEKWESDLMFVKGLKVTEVYAPLYEGGGWWSSLSLIWRGNALSWNVWLQRPGQAWEKIGVAHSPSFHIRENMTVGQTYKVAVSIGGPDSGEWASIVIRGKMAPPANVENFRVAPQGDAIILSWDHIADADLSHYVIRMGVSWESSVTIAEKVVGNSFSWEPSKDGTYRFWIKAIDMSGLTSEEPAFSACSIDISNDLNVIITKTEFPDGVSLGVGYNFVPIELDTSLSWIPSMTDSDFPGWYTDLSVSKYCGDPNDGAYTSQVYDLSYETKYRLRISTEFSSLLDKVTDMTYPSRTDRTHPGDTDIKVTTNSYVSLLYRTSRDGVSFSDWVTYATPIDLYSRFFQIQARTVADSPSVRLLLDEITTTADVEDVELNLFDEKITEDGRTYVIASLGVRPFAEKYEVSVIVLGTDAIFPTLVQKTDQFSVYCHDVNGFKVSASVNITIRGY